MFKQLKAIFVLILFGFPLLATADDIDIKLLNSGRKELDAGTNMNVLLMITNKTSIEKELEIKLGDEVRDVKLITDYSSVLVKGNSSTNKIISLQILKTCHAGDFTLTLEIIDKKDERQIKTVEIPVTIKPRYELSIKKIRSPRYLFSGDTSSISYLIENFSNLDVIVKTKSLYNSKTKEEEILIKKDTGFNLVYPITLPTDINRYMQQSVILIANIKDIPNQEVSCSVPLEIFPSSTAKFDKYERFPIKIAGIAATTNRYGSNIYSTLFDITGEGFIGKQNEDRLAFQFRGPDRTGNPLFGLNDLYYLKYDSKPINITIGDYSYGLSELTESSRNGKGIELRYNLRKLTIGGYYTTPRYYPLIKNVYSIHSQLTFDSKNSLKIGYLAKQDTLKQSTNLFSLSTSLMPFTWFNLALEGSVGEKEADISNAYKASASFSLPHFTTNFNYLYASPEFVGYLKNSIRIKTNSTLKFKNVGFSFGYSINKTNVELDSIYSNLPYSKNLNLTANLKLSKNNSISAGAYYLLLKDQAQNPLFDYTKFNGRIAINSSIGPVKINAQGDFGKLNNKLVSEGNSETLSYSGTLSSFYSLQKIFSINTYITYQGGQRNIAGYDYLYYGGSCSINLGSKFDLSLQYNSNFEWQYYTFDRNLLALTLNSQINKNNEIKASIDYNLVKNSLNKKELNVQIRYVHTLNVPISKKKDLGSVSGKLLNNGVESIKGIRVNLNNTVAITNNNGEFRFPAIGVGTHFLDLDFSTIDLNAITDTPGPYQVEVQPGKETHLDISITKSCRVIGHIIVKEDERANQKGYIPVKERIDRLIVEANNGKDVFRVYSDKDGVFQFQDLRPGDWKIVVYPNGIPSGYKLINDVSNIKLTSGEDKQIEIFIEKKARQVQFQNSFK